MQQVIEEIKRRSDGILVAFGLLLLVFGFTAILLRTDHPVSMSNPVWFVGLMIIFAAALALIALVFKWLGLATPGEAFGLPPGSVRTLLAVVVIVLFAVFGIAAINTDENIPLHSDGQLLTEAVTPQDKAASEVERYQGMQMAAIPVTTDASGVTHLKVYRMDRSRPADTVDLLKQIITALVTLVTSVVSFYFGSRSVEAATRNKDGSGGTVTMPASRQDDLDGIDADLGDLENRLTALGKEAAKPGSETAFATSLSQATAALASCKERRAKIDATAKDLSTGNSTLEALGAAIDTLKQSVADLKAQVVTAEGLVTPKG
jgi:hypothetical protein